MKTKHEGITKAKIKRAESADREGSTTNELYCSLTVKYAKLPSFF